METNSLLQILITSIVQGITEFLPISSSGHLFLINKYFEWEEISLILIVTAHLGTLFAVIYYFWEDFKKYFIFGSLEIFKKNKTSNFKLLINIFYSSMPIIFFGFIIIFNKLNFIYSPLIISFSAIFFSLLLLISDKNETKTNIKDISFKDAIAIGFFQIFALIPGSSRTGVCISCARFLGFNRICATKYSMYLSIPAILGATLLIFFEILKKNSFFLWIEVSLVFILSFLLAFLTISFFLKLLKKINFTIFVIYRIVIALFFLILFYF